MTAQTTNPTRHPSNWTKWLDIRRRQVGMWAFVMNRLSAIGLVVYLFLHLIVLSTLSRGSQAYDQFIALVRSPLFTLSELVVVIGGIYHGLNGIRVILTSLGVAVPYQKTLFWIFFGIAAIASLAFAYRMFTA